jgi:hypothetical protein
MWRFNNNRLLKLYMIDGFTTSRCTINKKSGNMAMLLSKMANLGTTYVTGRFLKFEHKYISKW